VADEVNSLQGWLGSTDLGPRAFGVPFPELAGDPSRQQIRDALETPARPWTQADAAVVFVTGHGLATGGAHWIMLHDSDRTKPRLTALRSADLVGWLADTEIEHVLLILDLCHAGAAAAETASFDTTHPCHG
jgi:uncharacterized caspase-like protein